MTVKTFRIVYRYENDDTEYAVNVDETSAEAAKAALMRVEPIIIVRCDEVPS